MAEGGEDLVDWLRELFDGLGLDGDVYGSYILGTLTSLGRASLSEVEESLGEILISLVVSVDWRIIVSLPNGSLICRRTRRSVHLWQKMLQLSGSSNSRRRQTPREVGRQG